MENAQRANLQVDVSNKGAAGELHIYTRTEMEFRERQRKLSQSLKCPSGPAVSI